MKYRFFTITTRSYTHVGQGAADSGVIDNLIQRDPQGIPVMNASSLKGAFRAHCKEILEYNSDLLNLLFGSKDDPAATNAADKTVFQSMINFHDARLLFLPVGALYEKATYYATSDGILQRYYTLSNKLMGRTDTHSLPLPNPGDNYLCFRANQSIIKPSIEGIRGEFHQADPNFLRQETFPGLANEKVAIFEEERIRDICKFCIPVIERNCLDEGGISKNKFNEEVLPYDTLLWFFLSYPENLEEQWLASIDGFIKAIQNTYVQIGANFSLSQGLCEIKELQHDSPTEQ